MKQAIAGVTPASEREVTVMIVWPSVAAMSLGPVPARAVARSSVCHQDRRLYLYRGQSVLPADHPLWH